MTLSTLKIFLNSKSKVKKLPCDGASNMTKTITTSLIAKDKNKPVTP